MSDTQNYMHPVLFRKQRAMSVDFLATSPNAKITTLQYIQIFIVSKVSDGYLTFELPIWLFFFRYHVHKTRVTIVIGFC